MIARRTIIAPLIAVVCCLSTGSPTIAADTLEEVYLQPFSACKPAELPSLAAKTVSRAPEDDRNTVAIIAIRTVGQVRLPAVIPSVGAISKAAPETAASVAGAAAELMPKKVVQIAKAAASAAPDKAADIVYAVCKRNPKTCYAVATAVAKIAPEQREAILAAIGEVIPSLEPYIAVLSSAGNASVATILRQAADVAQGDGVPLSPVVAAGSGPNAGGPVVGPPFQDLTEPPDETNPGGSRDVPEGGRDYATPGGVH